MICGLGKISSGKPCIILNSNLWMQKDRINQTNSEVKHHLLSSHRQREEVLIVAWESVDYRRGKPYPMATSHFHWNHTWPLSAGQACAKLPWPLLQKTLWSGWQSQQQPWPGRHLHLHWVMARGSSLPCAGGGSAVVDLANREYKHETWKKLLVSTPTKHPAILGSSLMAEVKKTLF